MKNLRPIGPQILLRAIKPADPKPGEFYLPNGGETGPQRAEVVALGSGNRDERGKITPFEVKQGDIVLVNRFASAGDLQSGAERYILVREDDILGIMLDA